MNARKLAIGGLLTVLVGLTFVASTNAGTLENETKHSTYVRAGYYDPNAGFVWGAPTLLQPGFSVGVMDGSNVYVSWQHLNGQWSHAHRLGKGQERDFLVLNLTLVDVTRRHVRR